MTTDMATLYEDVVKTSTKYLGPAAERFVDRQVKFHLKKEPKDLTKEDLKKITEWFRVALAMITDDEATVASCMKEIEQLTS